MAQRGVKDAARAKFLAPANGKEARGFIVRMRVEGQEDMDLLAMKVLEQVNFVKNRKGRTQVTGGRVFWVVVPAIDPDLGVMGLKLGAEHFYIRRETVEGVAGGVHSDERL